MKYLLLVISVLVTFYGCSADITYYELPAEFRNPQKKIDFLKKYSKYLSQKKIFIDPGHGGEDRKNIGSQGLAVEADVNLNVALALRDFLREANAEVVMSRDKDTTINLKDRSAMANESGADLFISIHHNAPGVGGDESINYTSTYYHATEEDYEYEPCERDVAKFIQRDLSYAMRNSGGLGSFDGTYSDCQIYPKVGFSVLRLTEIPAVLVECGFFTNPHEERRLVIDEFNRIQAWGIFRGIARYYAVGIPQIEFVTNMDNFDEANPELIFVIKDSAGINSKSIRVFIDSVQVQYFNFDERTGILTVPFGEYKDGEHLVRIIAANKNGNHTLPFQQKIIAKSLFKSYQ